MPGQFGSSPDQDGAVATTSSSAANWVVGSNADTQPVPVGTAGGSGVRGVTAVPDAAGVSGRSDAVTGTGVFGEGPSTGVHGVSGVGAGLLGHSDIGAAAQVESRSGSGLLAFGHSSDQNTVHAINDSLEPRTRLDGEPRGAGVMGQSSAPGSSGVHGLHSGGDGAGVRGRGPDSGVDGHSTDEVGVLGSSIEGNGVEAVAEGRSIFASFLKEPFADQSVRRELAGRAHESAGRLEATDASRLAASCRGSLADRLSAGAVEVPRWVRAVPDRERDAERLGVIMVPIGIGRLSDDLVERPRGNGVWGHTKVPGGSGVLGTVEPGTRNVAGVTGVGDTAGRFFGVVEVVGGTAIAGGLEVGGDAEVRGSVDVRGSIDVRGDIRLVGADFAEGFDTTAAVSEAAPGSVMVMDDRGGLTASTRAYDTKVAGVVSGAGGLRPGVLLDQAGDQAGRVPIALVGKVCALADAESGPIAVGDLLTTSSVPGHAMRVSDPARALGAVLGKAMQPLAEGRGLIMILVALQ